MSRTQNGTDELPTECPQCPMGNYSPNASIILFFAAK